MSLTSGVTYVLIQVTEAGEVRIICCGSCGVKASWKFLLALEVETVGAYWSI